MVEPGIKLKALVTRIEEYGVWLDYQGERVLVLVPELSWSPIRTNEVAKIGMELEVIVLRYNYKDNVIVGSARRVDPRTNPYREIARLEASSILTGKVKGFSARDARVDLPNGAIGYIRQTAIPLKTGDDVQVRVSALEVDEGHLTLELIRPVSDMATAIGESIAQSLASTSEGLKP